MTATTTSGRRPWARTRWGSDACMPPGSGRAGTGRRGRGRAVDEGGASAGWERFSGLGLVTVAEGPPRPPAGGGGGTSSISGRRRRSDLLDQRPAEAERPPRPAAGGGERRPRRLHGRREISGCDARSTTLVRAVPHGADFARPQTATPAFSGRRPPVGDDPRS